jgi:uncharacterized protein
VYRDPVHGDIAYPKGPFEELVRQLVDTELFQRLRGIRQNGVTHLVFHVAEHSRFAHSGHAAGGEDTMITAEARARAVGLIAYLVKQTDGIDGRVRLQKSLYLLRRKGVGELAPFAFTYHHYGPYSEDLAGLLTATVQANAVREDAQRFDEEWQQFKYKPGPAIDEYAPLVSEESRPLVDQVIAATRDAHWRVLELAATVDFLRREGTPGEAAVEKAIALKPACKPFVDDAKAMLARLEL